MRTAEVDVVRVAAGVARRFPGTSAWLGKHSGSWWAITRDRTGADHLVEAATPAELVRRLDGMDVRRAAPTGGAAPAPKYTRAHLAAAPSITAPDLAYAPAPARPRASPPARPPREHPRRAPRRGWLRTAFATLVAS